MSSFRTQVVGKAGSWRVTPSLRRALSWLGGFLVSATLVSAADARPLRVAGLTTVYRHNSHADVILSRLLLTDMLDGTGQDSPLRLVSLYTDQRPENDISRLLAASHRFRIYSNITETLCLGTGKLAVDGVLLVAEHGDYPRSPSGNTRYPKRRFWDEMIQVFRASGRVVPVFLDKHLADNWEDAKHIYDTARELGVPLMAGSSVPGTWRRPSADVVRGAKLSEILMLTFGSTDHYGFHALECVQALAEQREGGETGVRSVRCRQGDAVRTAWREGRIDAELFDAAYGRLSHPRVGKDEWIGAVPAPLLWEIEYRDGLRAVVLELNGAVSEWAGAWREAKGRRVDSTLFWTQEARPAAHFTLLLQGVERMMSSGRPSWNVERTLLSSGLLDALLHSCAGGGARIETPHLEVAYQPLWRWHEPPPPPPSRPWSEQ